MKDTFEIPKLYKMYVSNNLAIPSNLLTIDMALLQVNADPRTTNTKIGTKATFFFPVRILELMRNLGSLDD